MKRIAIIGSRGISDPVIIKKCIEKVLDKELLFTSEICIVSGGARGVDSAAELWADTNGVEKLIFPAEWDKYGKSAGYRRNVDIIENCDMVLAVWDGNSRGTAHSLSLAVKRGIPIYLSMNGMDPVLTEDLEIVINFKTTE